MAKATKTKAKADTGKVSVDFSGVESRILLPEGDYHVRVKSVELEESSAGNPYLKWIFATIDEEPGLNNKSVYHNTSLQPQALWNLRNLLETLGVSVPESAVELDLEEFIDLEMVASLAHEDYQGKPQVRITGYAPYVEDEEPDEEPVKVDKASKATKKERKVTYTEDEIGEKSREDLIELIGAEGLDLDPATFKTLRKLQSAIIDALEEREQIENE